MFWPNNVCIPGDWQVDSIGREGGLSDRPQSAKKSPSGRSHALCSGGVRTIANPCLIPAMHQALQQFSGKHVVLVCYGYHNKIHRPGALHNRSWFSSISGGWKSKIKVLMGLLSLSGFQMAVFYEHMCLVPLPPLQKHFSLFFNYSRCGILC